MALNRLAARTRRLSIRAQPSLSAPLLQAAVAYREGRAMVIYRLNTLLAETGHLIAAYELTLRALSLDRNDPLTAMMIANKVIEIGATGL